MGTAVKNFSIWIPLMLLLVNLLLFSFLTEELMDASTPNFGGGLGLLTPLVGLVSFLYIKRAEGEKPLYFWFLQAMNWLFMIFPVAALLIAMAAFL